MRVGPYKDGSCVEQDFVWLVGWCVDVVVALWRAFALLVLVRVFGGRPFVVGLELESHHNQTRSFKFVSAQL